MDRQWRLDFIEHNRGVPGIWGPLAEWAEAGIEPLDTTSADGTSAIVANKIVLFMMLCGPKGASREALALEGKASNLAKGPIWSSTKKLSSIENALGHWTKHKAEFPELANSKQYVEAAHPLAANPPYGALMKSRGAETLIYDRATNTTGEEKVASH